MTDDEPLVLTWFGEGRYGRMPEVIAWLHEQVVPAARASSGCHAAEAFVEDGDGHEVLLVTTWATVEDADEWDVGDHPALRSSGGQDRWSRLDDAFAAIRRRR